MTLKREYDNMPGEFKHLIANSDSEIAELEQAAHPVHVELPTAAPLSARESAALRQEIEANGLIREVLGVDMPSALHVDATLLGADGKPLNKSASDELESSFRRLINAVVTGVERGDPEALALVQTGRDHSLAKSGAEKLKHQMAEAADEFAPTMAPFVKAWATNDLAAMRRAVRPIAEEMVAAEA
jgi:hypothetical protein